MKSIFTPTPTLSAAEKVSQITTQFTDLTEKLSLAADACTAEIDSKTALKLELEKEIATTTASKTQALKLKDNILNLLK